MEMRKLDLSGIAEHDLYPVRDDARFQNDSRSGELGQRPGDRRHA
jgi:hypothetical protein